ncbi:FAD/NAD(P)-binding oxidoreductase family protein [Striga asiatica]|uniref:FAD/NAD(P)-binding oxidoreductase family protein n=1 Tax=Striga asiatica TaxID=4170 RepID=A0A5A7R4T6_STRAF|nr:FAD/NAD(P)-binding oxidoreductase family protein [Striga asiatica]
MVLTVRLQNSLICSSLDSSRGKAGPTYRKSRAPENHWRNLKPPIDLLLRTSPIFRVPFTHSSRSIGFLNGGQPKRARRQGPDYFLHQSCNSDEYGPGPGSEGDDIRGGLEIKTGTSDAHDLESGVLWEFPMRRDKAGPRFRSVTEVAGFRGPRHITGLRRCSVPWRGGKGPFDRER